MSVYLSPNMGSAQYIRRLDAMEGCLRGRLLLSYPILVAGDFNAKSPLWGSPRQDGRGRILADWAAGLCLCVLNTSSRSRGSP